MTALEKVEAVRQLANEIKDDIIEEYIGNDDWKIEGLDEKEQDTMIAAALYYACDAIYKSIRDLFIEAAKDLIAVEDGNKGEGTEWN